MIGGLTFLVERELAPELPTFFLTPLSKQSLIIVDALRGFCSVVRSAAYHNFAQRINFATRMELYAQPLIICLIALWQKNTIFLVFLADPNSLRITFDCSVQSQLSRGDMHSNTLINS